ncbi:hypothetical protein [Beduinella massiliensis]|uniref:hypothetical protein n=1 Tax=Beduinella massiliensis TaxID=1852363 RepID=UPI000C845CA1
MTKLNRWYDLDGVYTRDSWTIPDEGTEIWCTGWKRGQTISPYGDDYHVVVGFSVYHCDQLMEILSQWERDGYTWGLEGVAVQREQQINGCWTPVQV